MESVAQKKSANIDFRHVIPAKRRPSQYEEVTLYTQWSPKHFATQGWFSTASNGRPPWSEDSTRLQASDWWRYRDPTQEWFRSYVEHQAKQEDAIELAVEGATLAGLFPEISPTWQTLLSRYYAAYRYLEYGLFLCFSHAQREALSDVAANPLVFQGLDKDRHAQAIALYGMDLESAIPGFSDADAQRVWLDDPIYQPSREFVERMLACRDWGEITVAVNLLFEPLAATLLLREFFMRFAGRHGDTVTPVILETVEADRRRHQTATVALLQFLFADTPANRAVVQEWLQTWAPLVVRAARAFAPLFEQPEEKPLTFITAWRRVAQSFTQLLDGLQLQTPPEVR
jgi:hypothetical protein